MMTRTAYQVKVNILNHSASYIGEPLYLTGSFNNWAKEHLFVGKIPEHGKQVSVILPEIEGDLELRLSRGSRDTLACSKDGRLQLPCIRKIDKDSEIGLTIEGWRDQFPKSTASEQVHILDERFFFPRLNAYKKVWIYLPKGYSGSGRKYPVIYMHDGQHLFDEATSAGRAGPVEWMVDETIDDARFPSIVVAIEHPEGPQLRQQEYMVNPGYGTENPQGWLYVEDIVKSLKPYVDKQYRTFSSADQTAIAGSSLGGLVSIYAGLKYPGIFGTVAAFSPSIWIDEEQLYSYAKNSLTGSGNIYAQQEYFFYAGEKERKRGVMTQERSLKLDLLRFHEWLSGIHPGKLQVDIHPEGRHGAIYWQPAFRKFYDYWQTKTNNSQINNKS